MNSTNCADEDAADHPTTAGSDKFSRPGPAQRSPASEAQGSRTEFALKLVISCCTVGATTTGQFGEQNLFLPELTLWNLCYTKIVSLLACTSYLEQLLLDGTLLAVSTPFSARTPEV
jgi:hypothetical protein